MARATGRTRPPRPPADPGPPTRGRRVAALVALAVGGFAAAYAVTSLVAPGRRTDAPAGMVRIPGGEFTMGTDAALGRADEQPAHRVRVSAFFLDEHEVTNAQFRAFVAATGYAT